MSRLWPTFVNPELGLTRQERKEVHRAAWKLWSKDWRNVLAYVLLIAAYVALAMLADVVLPGLAVSNGTSGGVSRIVYLRAAVKILLPLFVFVVGGAVLQRLRFAPCVYRALRDRGHDVCTVCGYWLRGLGDDATRCPECGASRDAR